MRDSYLFQHVLITLHAHTGLAIWLAALGATDPESLQIERQSLTAAAVHIFLALVKLDGFSGDLARSEIVLPTFHSLDKGLVHELLERSVVLHERDNNHADYVANYIEAS